MKLLLAVSVLAGCTHWSTSNQPHAPHETGRMLVGSPMVQQDTASSVEAGFAGTSYDNGYGTTAGVAGLSGNSGTVTRTHCVQQAQVDLVQDIDVVPTQADRALDVAGAVLVGVAALGTYGEAQWSYGSDKDKYEVDKKSYESDLSFYQMNPSFFPEPTPPTEPTPPRTAYFVAGGLAISAGAWLLYSLTSLPRGSAPEPTHQQRHWTETRYVEATGCGLVPADRAASK